MTTEQAILFALLASTLALFIWDRWRYDVIALLALFIAVVAGLVPADRAFDGFAQPVVTTVAAVMVMSAAVRSSGALEYGLTYLQPLLNRPALQTGVFVGLVCALSAFMNNVGALALLMPLAIQAARKAGRSPSELLMPLAFGSLLGGLITLIGTPPNLLIADVRANILGEPYGMFDFAPVGLAIATVGAAFLAVGWRLLPRDRQGRPPPEARFEITDYTSELRVSAKSPFIGMSVAEIETASGDDAAIVAIVRGSYRQFTPNHRERIAADDILVVESDPATLKRLVDKGQLEVVGQQDLEEAGPASQDVGAIEAVVSANSLLVGRSLQQTRLRRRFNLNVLAVRRQGRRLKERLSQIRFQVGDVLVIHGEMDALPESLRHMGCLPLAERNLTLGRTNRIWLAPAAMATAVCLSAMEVLPIQIALLGVVVAILLARAVTLAEAYTAVDWPVVILLGAMIPVVDAMQTTKATDLIATFVQDIAQGLPPVALIAMVLVATMAVTPVLNNAATVLLMAPLAADIAGRLGVSIDAVLMAVAIGASCDFLTPIGHQSNTLVMGPGGYRFGDYARLGAPLSILVVAIGTPLIALVWGVSATSR